MLPQELREYLSDTKNLKHVFKPENQEWPYDIQRLEFFHTDEIRLQKFLVSSWELFENGPLDFDPKEEKEFEGYDLVKDCNDYSPEGILVWFPEFNAFGTTDVDHGRIYLFPQKSWAEILQGLDKYVNCQWEPEFVENEELNPWSQT